MVADLDDAYEWATDVIRARRMVRCRKADHAFRFSNAAIQYLRSLGFFEADFLDFLHDVRFTGSVRAMPEGTVLVAPILEAQLGLRRTHGIDAARAEATEAVTVGSPRPRWGGHASPCARVGATQPLDFAKLRGWHRGCGCAQG